MSAEKVIKNMVKIQDEIMNRLNEDVDKLQELGIASRREIIEEHRKEYKLTCPENCWCWDAEKEILKYEQRGRF